jgi:hypothetical protein
VPKRVTCFFVWLCDWKKKNEGEEERAENPASTPQPEKTTTKKTHRALLAQVDGKPKVRDAQPPPGRQQGVLGLDVAVHDP